MKRTAIAIVATLMLVPILCFGAMYRSELVVGFTGSGTQEDSYRPDIGAYTIDKFEDTTGTEGARLIPDPNLYVIKVEADNATLDQMVTDGMIELWREKIVEPLGPGASLLYKALDILSSFFVSEAYAQNLPMGPGRPGDGGNKDEKLDKAKLDKIKQDLKQKGMRDADLNKTALGNTSTADLTRQELARQLADVMSKFPKKGTASAEPNKYVYTTEPSTQNLVTNLGRACDECPGCYKWCDGYKGKD